MENVLMLLKIDLGINHIKRDSYFNDLISSCQKEIERKGIVLDLEEVEDQMLLSDFSAWKYRTRTEDTPLSSNLVWRIRNRIIKERADSEV